MPKTGPKGKFTDEEIRTMRQEVANGMSQAKAGQKYGISQAQVSRIVNYRQYADVR